ncbi:MAG TPA: hypothetical protein VEA92_01455 [Candidatus Paceibacterota bacterium]|nr:hypothetical protein [Candidatus Paceibacterota bacterium]
MRKLVLATSVFALLATATAAQERERSSAELVSDCVASMRTENGLSERDLNHLQQNHPYLVYGRPYTLDAGNTASDICRIAIFTPLAARYDLLVEELNGERTKAADAVEAQGLLRTELEKYERPLGLDLPPSFLDALNWLRGHWPAGWLLGFLFSAYACGHIYSQTPWGKASAARAHARRWRNVRENPIRL